MKKCKVYRDGGMHYIAIAPSEGYSGVRRKPPPEEPIAVVDQPPDPIEEENQTDALPVEEDVSDISAAEEFSLPEYSNTEDTDDVTITAGEKRISTRSEEFLRWYRESLELKKKRRYSFIASKMAPYFTDKEELHRFLHRKLACRVFASEVGLPGTCKDDETAAMYQACGIARYELFLYVYIRQ